MPDHVTVHLYATFRKHAQGQSALHVAIAPGQSVEELLRQLGVPVEQTRILFCNHRLVGLDHPLQGGETVGVFPAMGGG
jgi:molybdopterin converting factor small subunit